MGFFDKVKNVAEKIDNTVQPQQPNNTNNSYTRQHINQIQYDSRTLGIDTSSDIESLKNVYRGRRLSRDGSKYIYFEGGQQIMSEGGAEWLLAYHQKKMSISNATTNLDNNDEIFAFCENYGDNLNELMCAKYRDWKIDKSFFDMIIDGQVDDYQLFLKKTVGDRQRKHMHGNGGPEPQQPLPQTF